MMFGLTLAKSKSKKISNVLDSYSFAYVLLSLAFFGFAIASVIGSAEALAMSVVVGDFLILAATCFISNILLQGNRYRIQVLAALAIVGVGATMFRVAYFYPEPYMTEGILFFNSQRFVNFTLSSIFLLLWLPVNLRIARLQLTKRKEAHALASGLTYAYTVAIFAALIFILAKTPLVLVMSFTAMCACYLMLVVSNLAIRKVKEV